MEIADDAEPPVAPRRRWPWLAAGAVVLVALALTGVSWWRKARVFHPARAEEGRALGLDLPSMMATMTHAKNAEQADTIAGMIRSGALTPRTREVLGPEGVARLEATVKAAVGLVAGGAAGASGLSASVLELTEEVLGTLAQQGWGRHVSALVLAAVLALLGSAALAYHVWGGEPADGGGCCGSNAAASPAGGSGCHPRVGGGGTPQE